MTGSRTLQALGRVLIAHPLAKSGYLHMSGEVLESGHRLYQRLCALLPAEREKDIRALSGLQSRLLAHVIGVRLSEEHAPELLKALAHWQPGAVDPKVAVEAWLLVSDGAAFLPYVRVWRDKHQHDTRAWDQLVTTTRARGTSPMLYLRDAFLGGSGAWSSFGWGRALEQHGWVHAIRSLQCLLLLAPVLRDTARLEGPESLLKWAEHSFTPSDRDRWLATFINTTMEEGWNRRHPILELVHSRFGAPRGHSFWAQVSDAGVDRYTRWLVEHELRNLLGEGPRVEFWRRFIGEKMEVPVRSRDGDAVLLPFPHCVAVQFVEMGRATFLVERRQLSQLRKLDAQQLYAHVRQLHNLNLTLGRYAHHGYHWEHQAEAIVRHVLAGAS